MIVPKNTPQAIIDVLYHSLLKAEKSEFYQNFAKNNVLFLTYKGTAELRKQLNQSCTFYKEFLKKIDLVPQKK